MGDSVNESMAAAQRPILIAHRGGNNRRAIRSALAAGVDWIEVDVWLHYGRLVARHGASIWRLPLTYDRRLRLNLMPVLQLEQLIEATRAAGTRLLVDLKGDAPELSSTVVRALRRRGALERSALCGQAWPPLEAARTLDPSMEVIFSIGRPTHLNNYLARRRDESAPAATSCAHVILNPDNVALLKAAGSTVVAWTVDSEARARTLLSWGVDGIISNNYAMLTRLRRSVTPSAGPAYE